MLNISKVSVLKYINTTEFKSYKKLKNRTNSKVLTKILLAFLFIAIASMFLPWTQNIRSKGFVTTLNPYDKPQSIQALVGGQVSQWYVTEGDLVEVGDTIAVLTEAKEAYLDPEILSNTKEQQMAKMKSADAYETKSAFLQDQIAAIQGNQKSKLNQVKIKQQQLTFEQATVEMELEAAKIYAENSKNQLARTETMYNKGIKSLTDFETKRLSFQEAQAKQNSAENKLNKIQTQKENLGQEVELVKADFQQKLAKIESDIRSTDAYKFSLLGESNKLQSKYNQIEKRQSSFIITSPVNGRITKLLKNGIGEYVKAQESIATIVPTDYQKAVELYIEPNDMPLINRGKKVRLQFDGWPAVVFSGWPENSFGTFDGEIFAIDNEISSGGKYRVLVIEDASEKLWPDLIRIGSGAQGLLLLNEVRVYYELWRQLNGFPPDFYKVNPQKQIKNKAPLKKIK